MSKLDSLVAIQHYAPTGEVKATSNKSSLYGKFEVLIFFEKNDLDFDILVFMYFTQSLMRRTILEFSYLNI